MPNISVHFRDEAFFFFVVVVAEFYELLIFHVELICHVWEGKCFQPLYQKGIVRGLSSCLHVNG